MSWLFSGFSLPILVRTWSCPCPELQELLSSKLLFPQQLFFAWFEESQLKYVHISIQQKTWGTPAHISIGITVCPKSKNNCVKCCILLCGGRTNLMLLFPQSQKWNRFFSSFWSHQPWQLLTFLQHWLPAGIFLPERI